MEKIKTLALVSLVSLSTAGCISNPAYIANNPASETINLGTFSPEQRFYEKMSREPLVVTTLAGNVRAFPGYDPFEATRSSEKYRNQILESLSREN